MSPRKPSPGHSLAEHNPELLIEWSPKNKYSAWEVSYGSNSKKYWWKCLKGHEDYEATCNNRTNGRGCSICGKAKFQKNRTTPPYSKSLLALFPDIASTWSPENTTTPDKVYPYSHHIKRLWVCKYCGEEYKMMCSDRCNGQGCRSCSENHYGEQRSIPPYNLSLGYLNPISAFYWSTKNSRTVFEVYCHEGKIKRLWICSICGKEYKSTCANKVRRAGSTCRQCCNNQISLSEQHLRTALIPFGASSDSQTKLGPWKVDIYIPSSKTVVEYDGSYYHSSDRSYERDKRKSLELLEEGYRVIRVRTYGTFILDPLQIDSPNYFEIFDKEPRDSQPTEELLEQIKEILCQKS